MFEKEVKAMTAKYTELKQPILDKRDLIINGDSTDFSAEVPKFDAEMPILEEIVAGHKANPDTKKKSTGVDTFADDSDNEEEKEHIPTDVSYLKDKAGIPGFWTTAVKNNQMLMQNWREKDREILPFLKKVHVNRQEDPKIITFTLTFNENEFFTNESLTATVRFKEHEDDEVENVDGCAIEWKDGKDVTKKKIKKKQKHKKSGETRTIVKSVQTDSFFNVFESKTCPKTEDDDSEDEQDEDKMKLMDQLDEAMQIGEDLHDLYYSDGLEYFLNHGQDLGDFAGMMGQGEGPEDEDEGDEEMPPKKKGGKSKGGAPTGEEAKQECKQQ